MEGRVEGACRFVIYTDGVSNPMHGAVSLTLPHNRWGWEPRDPK